MMCKPIFEQLNFHRGVGKTIAIELCLHLLHPPETVRGAHQPRADLSLHDAPVIGADRGNQIIFGDNTVAGEESLSDANARGRIAFVVSAAGGGHRVGDTQRFKRPALGKPGDLPRSHSVAYGAIGEPNSDIRIRFRFPLWKQSRTQLNAPIANGVAPYTTIA